MSHTSRRLAPLMAALLIAACGSDGATSDTGSPATTTASEPIDLVADVAYNSSQLLDIYVPSDGSDWPVVVYLHGGVNDADARKTVADTGEALAAQGVLTYVPTWNGLGPAGGSQDTICAVAYAHATAAEHGGDPDRLMNAGYSAGGWGAVIHALLGDTAPLPVDDCVADATVPTQTVVAAGGAPFFVAEWAREGAFNQPEWTGLTPEQIDVFDPYLAVEAGVNPELRLVLFVGERDVGGTQSFPIAESTLEFDEAARAAGYDVELTVVPGGHLPPQAKGTEQFDAWIATIAEAAHSQP